MEFTPFLAMFFKFLEASILEGNEVMDEEKPADMTGWEISESVDEFGIPHRPNCSIKQYLPLLTGVQIYYVNKREIRCRRIAINAMCSVMSIFSKSAEGYEHPHEI